MMAMLRYRNRVSTLGLAGVLILALAGCATDATTTTGDSVRSSGFMSDYSMLRRGDEGETRDALSGVLLAAGIDQRAGTKALGVNTFDSWGDVREAFEAWAVRFRDNLRKRRN